MFRKATFCLLLFVFISIPLFATRVARLDLTEIRDKSATVFRGTVVDVETRLDESGALVWTDYSVVPEEVLFGKMSMKVVKLSFAGGTHAGKTLIVHGMPYLVAGKSYVFFLEKASKGAPLVMPITGWGQGIFQFVEGPDRRQALVSFDQEPIDVLENGMVKRGPRVNIVNGMIADRPFEPMRKDASLATAEPVARNADGSVAPRGPKPLVIKELSVSQRRFATMDDLRAFVERRVDEAPRPDAPTRDPRTQQENR